MNLILILFVMYLSITDKIKITDIDYVQFSYMYVKYIVGVSVLVVLVVKLEGFLTKLFSDKAD